METFAKSYNSIMDSLISERYVPVLDVLEKYKDDDNAFLSFTADITPTSERSTKVDKKGTKIGINPRSGFKTPIGVYCYPIKAYWDNIERNKIDFAGDQPHLYVFKAKNPEKLLVASKYTIDDYTKDFQKLDEIFGNIYDIGQIEDDLSIHNSDYFDENKPAQLFWTLTREIAIKITEKQKKSNRPVIWTQILRRFYDGVVDDMDWGFIHQMEPTQAVLWTKAQFDVVDYINRKDKTNNSLKAWKENDKSIPIKKMLSYIGKLKKPIQDSRMMSMISKSAMVSYRYASDVLNWKNVPDEILKGISTETRFSYEYATEILKNQNVPDIILKGISQDSLIAYRYAREELKGKGVPDIILKGISNNPSYANSYASNVLMYNNVPDIIINSIHTSTTESYDYARNLYNLKKDVAPDIILKTIAKNEHNSIQYTATLYFNPIAVLKFAKVFEKPSHIPSIIFAAISRNPAVAFKFIKEILIPKGISMDELFSGSVRYDFKLIAMAMVNDENYAKYIAKKYFKWTNVPKIFRDILTHNNLNMTRTGVPNTVTFTESFEFTNNYNFLMDSFKPESSDVDKIYESSNQEYTRSSGLDDIKKSMLEIKSNNFDSMYASILEKYTKKKKKKVSPLRSKCQAKAKAKYEVWPSAYASGYVQKCVKRKGKMN
jgi:hypothetical protein